MDTQLTMVMVPFTAGSVTSLKWISIWGCIEKGRGLVIISALVMSAKLLSSHGAQDITKVMGY
jgi:hypothetical protein